MSDEAFFWESEYRYAQAEAEKYNGWHQQACLEIERLRAALNAARRTHLYCDDCWYSCPKHEDGCCDPDVPKDKCRCGAEEHNAAIDEALRTQRLTQPLQNGVAPKNKRNP